MEALLTNIFRNETFRVVNDSEMSYQFRSPIIILYVNLETQEYKTLYRISKHLFEKLAERNVFAYK